LEGLNDRGDARRLEDFLHHGLWAAQHHPTSALVKRPGIGDQSADADRRKEGNCSQIDEDQGLLCSRERSEPKIDTLYTRAIRATGKTDLSDAIGNGWVCSSMIILPR
jgi:hypothetical protein